MKLKKYIYLCAILLAHRAHAQITTIEGNVGSATGASIAFVTDPGSDTSLIFSGSNSTMTLMAGDSNRNTALGEALSNLKSSSRYSDNTIIGYGIGSTTQGASSLTQNVILGSGAAATFAGSPMDGNVIVGYQAGNSAVGYAQSVILGYQCSPGGITNGVVIGTSANAQGTNQIALGTAATANGTSAIAMGNAASATNSNSICLGTGITDSNGPGTYIANIYGTNADGGTVVVATSSNQLGNGIANNPLQPAFLAYTSTADDIVGGIPNQGIIFDTTVYDQTGWFSESTFTVNDTTAAGVYQFNVTVNFIDNAGSTNPVTIDLQVNGVSVFRFADTVATTSNTVISGSVMVKLAFTDQVQVVMSPQLRDTDVTVNGATGPYVSFFSGALIC